MKLSLLDKLALLTKLNSTTNAVEEGIAMKDSTKVIAAIVSLLTVVAQLPAVQAGVASLISNHPGVAALLAGIAGILALLHVPMKGKVGMLILVLAMALTPFASAQTADAATLPTNIYAGGISFNSGGSPQVAGTGLYARLISQSAGTYAFTVVDALPVSVKPFTVSTNFGIGIAQKVATLAGVPIYIPTSAGISYTGTNTGWAWSTGGLASIKIKNNWRVMPTLRLVKSSVSNGAGYQPTVGVLFGWGQ